MLATGPLEELFERSRWLELDFSGIPSGIPKDQDIRQYFKTLEGQGLDPTSAKNRQAFNDHVLDKTGFRYLVSSYGEDRSAMLRGSEIAKQGRTIHLGIDIFCQNLEPVFAPCDAEVVETGYENDEHSFGNFIILRPDNPEMPYLFFGHLSNDSKPDGHVTAGEQIGRLGDHIGNENGGWSRHLHVQCFTELPKAAQERIGYLSRFDFKTKSHLYPNPMSIFSHWTPK